MASFTLGHGTYVFTFSIPFPQVSECYRTGTDGNRSRGSCRNVQKKHRHTTHLLRRLPPSTIRERETAGEISYTLKAIIRTAAIINKSEIITVERPMATITPTAKARDITFYPVTDFNPPSHTLIERHSVILNPGNREKPIPTSYQIDIRLSDGACLLLGEPIPLTIYMTRITGPGYDLILNDLQSMLLETTEVRAHGFVESRLQLHVLQTVSNVRKQAHPSGTPAGSTVSLDDDLWRHHRLPHSLTPTFETCNISRTYKLQIRLGFRFGSANILTRVLEAEFPVYVMAACRAKNPPRAS
ncbi:hypothetical protein KXV92_009056 [Aspergillus fumigatus]|nr:hypothetical protein KXX42_004006 [Aspergillus fumigatus]KAH1550746.1 hypothetical protein KXX57_009309 [Aspergillus fumigatus]KAH1981870.1 hypothetical protein KXW88_005258 [Aspergillus fumigatus]KAH2310151.1 hypothetical protein KXV47_005387 [Aspergillus fumigatus]KAH2653396.1 hypothetical protein KXV32_003438 [Aspergillus fumigatus]